MRYATVLVAVILFCRTGPGARADADASAAYRLAVEAEQARKAGDTATFLARMQASVAKQPKNSALLVRLAAAEAANGHRSEAIQTLQHLVSLGLYQSTDKFKEFAALGEDPAFQEIVRKLGMNQDPIGPASIALTLPQMPGLLEGVAWRKNTGEFFLSDVRERCIWRRTSAGEIKRFTRPDDRLLGVFRLAVDEKRHVLWAATSAVPNMKGFSETVKGSAGVAEIDLESGEVHRVVWVSDPGQNHLLGDFALAADGTLYVTDSMAPIVWRLSVGGDVLEKWLQLSEVMSLQGITLSADESALFLTDYGSGLLRVDLATKKIRSMAEPENASLLGCDTLSLAPDGSLLAIQNGTQPQRVLRLLMNSENTQVTALHLLCAGHAEMRDVTLGAIVGPEFLFIADGGWNLPTNSTEWSPRDVLVLKTSWSGR